MIWNELRCVARGLDPGELTHLLTQGLQDILVAVTGVGDTRCSRQRVPSTDINGIDSKIVQNRKKHPCFGKDEWDLIYK